MSEYTISELFYFIRDPLLVHLASFFVFFAMKYYRPPRYSDWIKRLHLSFGVFPFVILFVIHFSAGTLLMAGGPNFTIKNIFAVTGLTVIIFIGHFFLFLFALIAQRLQFFNHHPLILIGIYAIGTIYALWLALDADLTI